MVKLSAIQLSSAADVATNLSKIAKILTMITDIQPVVEQGSKQTTDLEPEEIHHLIVLPECCLYFGGKESDQLALAQRSAQISDSSSDKISDQTADQKIAKDSVRGLEQASVHSINQENDLCLALSALAKKFKVYLVAGTIPILAPSAAKFTNSSCVFDPSGKLIAQYDKIHLFDVTVSDSTNNYYESRYTQAGKEISVVNTGFANIGLSVCFDLRFPNLFQQLTKAGANIITVPSAFTKITGQAHWQTLLQARAIENQVYIIAAGQEGVHENGRETWGHSMIINPWGDIEQVIETGEGYISVDYQAETVTRIRQSMPLITPLNANLNTPLNT